MNMLSMSIFLMSTGSEFASMSCPKKCKKLMYDKIECEKS